MKTNPLLYRSPAAKWKIILPLTIAAAGLAAAAYVMPDPLNPRAWHDTIRASAHYLTEVARYSYKTRTTAAIDDLHIETAIFFSGAVVAPILAFAAAVALVIATPRRTHNISKYANAGEVKRMGLDGNLGPVLGEAHGKTLRPEETRHTIGVTPTRSGKTRQAISTILEYPGTVIVLDPKKEIKNIAGPHRAGVSEIMTLSFGDPNSPNGWNPLAYSNLPDRASDIELYASRLASVIVGENANAKDPHWDQTALRNVTAAIALLAFRAVADRTDSKFADLLPLFQDLPECGPKEDAFKLKMHILAGEAAAAGAPEWVARDLVSFGETAPNERSSHMSTLLAKLQTFRFSAVEKSLGHSDFTIPDLRDRPHTIFIDYPREDARAFGNLTAMFVDAIIAHALSRGREEGQYPILIVMDEFRDLPVIPNLISSMTAGAGLGLSLYILVQSLRQLKDRYGDAHHNILNNCDHWIIFENPDKETQEMLSAIVGKTEIEKRSRNVSKWGATNNSNVQRQREDLIAPADWGVIPFGKHILLVRRHLIRPILCNSVFWDQKSAFRRLVPRKNRIKT